MADMKGFIDRTGELDFLNSRWKEEKAQLIILYGKRRVGKTELIRHFIKDKPSIYFLAYKASRTELLREIGRLTGREFGDSILEKQGFPSWIDLFRYLKEKQRGPIILAMDEYPYLVESDKFISSVVQKGWDEYVKDSQIFMILSGSSIGMMESETLVHRAPLFGI